ncbi:MAG: GHMP kinase [Candidatus Niyogibacteria bacterium CG10_big_fil_rev_8_21_14_0_10_46_36]|uniref:GHMP kinase n=1 Tax=Candidatus Niyogibacteria bacterium CG10_big_fil_rev_8_21_14_0_10_46_36 TaxID=1974726 RepID=A0A2H0TEH4_9BACT|nr:MAG: GHMP kinase [Candidatus Niyogibacteria bacterium CG10_big_fil_rev_8_21_14_0_10_46_36]
MIISRTPFRISFVGGGTDFKEFYTHRAGSVVSTAIDKYVYVIVNRKFGDEVRVSYSQNEIVAHVSQVRHDIIREALTLYGITGGIEVVVVSDLPLRGVGTGLGASSSLAVGVLHALAAFKKIPVTPRKLAEDACRVEIDILGRPAGKQDQYAAAFGRLNYMQFYPDERVDVVTVPVSPDIHAILESNLLLFHTGTDTKSSVVLNEQKKRTSQNMSMLQAMVCLAQETQEDLRSGRMTLGQALHENWMHKRNLASQISNAMIDSFYEKARAAGASGGKILGSGGGGFLLLYCEPEHHAHVRKALSGLREMHFRFERTGSLIVYNDE